MCACHMPKRISIRNMCQPTQASRERHGHCISACVTLGVSEHIGEYVCPESVSFHSTICSFPNLCLYLTTTHFCFSAYNRYRGKGKDSEMHMCTLRNTDSQAQRDVPTYTHMQSYIQGQILPSGGNTDPPPGPLRAGCTHLPGIVTSPLSRVLEPRPAHPHPPRSDTFLPETEDQSMTNTSVPPRWG